MVVGGWIEVNVERMRGREVAPARVEQIQSTKRR